MRWKKWAKRVLLVVVLSVLARTVWLVGEREWLWAEGNREFAQAVAETEATDPDWHWEALAAVRRIPPHEPNGADLIPRVKALFPPAWVRFDNPKQWEPALPPQPPNERLPAETIAAARRELEATRVAVELARTFKDLPRGNRVIRLAPDVLSTPLQDTQDTRVVASLLRWDTILAVADGDLNRAADGLLALLNASRSVGDEPFLISQLVRIAVRSISAQTLAWVLGQVELPGARLAALQAAWAADAEEPLLLYGLRGERAAYDVFFRNIADGTVTPGLTPGGSGLTFESYSWWLYRGRVPHQRAYYHRWLTRAVEAARLPAHEQPAAIAALPPFPGDDFAMRLAALLLPAVEKVAASHRRSLAEARTVVVGLAVERYRLKHGTWPGSLANLPKELLEAVPPDPFDGKPLRYRLLPDGVVVYSVGMNGADDGGDVTHPANPGGADLGFRLWNPTSRRSPASSPSQVVPKD